MNMVFEQKRTNLYLNWFLTKNQHFLNFKSILPNSVKVRFAVKNKELYC